MNQHLAILDPGHGWKGVGWDPGARSHGAIEAQFVRLYVAAAALALGSAGVRVEVLGVGSYATRGALAVELVEEHRRRHPGARAVYLACHINALRTGHTVQRAEVFHGAAEAEGQRLALALCGRLARLDGISGAEARGCGPDRYAAPWACIRHAAAGGLARVVVEPGWLDCAVEAHRALVTTSAGLRTVGETLSAGVIDYFRNPGNHRSTS